MNKEEFNTKSIDIQVSVINALLVSFGSLRKACASIGISKSTVQSRFHKEGFILKDGSYYKSVLKDKELVVKKESDIGLSNKSNSIVQDSIDLINYKVKSIKRNFLDIGKELKRISDSSLYKEAGYENFYLFCEQKLNLNTTLVKNLISVYKKFGFSPKYSQSNFNFSQLVELVSCSEDIIKEVKPETTVKQIREKKKEFNNSNNPTAPESSSKKILIEDINIKINLKHSEIVDLIHSLEYKVSCTTDVLKKLKQSIYY